eukprot:TRINITY_DN31655_c0_g1_i1.p1 TRINITY_DN31655_c0_g1~~TRINITY_DN31655_c0_g1_i1.p1  ORF type:complete len:417 (+),score=88.52 TRINITY_DN31655_c0_g1_i1:49-1251(+)
MANTSQDTWPFSSGLMACTLLPSAVALRALQACLATGVLASMKPSALQLGALPWIAWPLIATLAILYRYCAGGAWFPSTAQAGRVVATAAMLGILDACASSLVSLVSGAAAGRTTFIVVLLRCLDVPLAAGISAAVTWEERGAWQRTSIVATAILGALPATAGLALASLLAERVGTEEPEMPACALLLASEASASLCRALRAALGARLLQRAVGVHTLGSLLLVAALSSFFGSLVALPLAIGLDAETSEALGGMPFAQILPTFNTDHHLELAAISVAVVFLGAAEAVARLAVLRHSEPVTSAALDAGLSPLAALMARSTTVVAAGGRTSGGEALEAAALISLLLSFLLLLQATKSKLRGPRDVSAGQAEDKGNPILLGRLGRVIEARSLQQQKRKKSKEV